MKQRILSVDFVKFISIFLVVWCHVIEGIDTDGFWQNSVHHVIYSFHMPLFFFLSGITLKAYRGVETLRY